jgi:thiol-disulfide isomerase/thioredoxin
LVSCGTYAASYRHVRGVRRRICFYQRMRPRSLFLFSFCVLAAAAASAAPMTLQELDLMVRMKVSDAEVLQDVSQRRLVASVDAAAERRLMADGASGALIAKLKAGDFVLPPDQAAAAARRAEEEKARVAREIAADAASSAERERLRAAPALPPGAPAAPGAGPAGQPLDIQFTAVDGRSVNLREMKGKVVLIDFWATWCGPCVQEIPHVKAAYDKLHGSGFEIIGLSFDQSKAKLDQFVADKGLPWPQYFDGAGWKNKYGSLFGIHSIPTMWLVDKQGVLRDVNARDGLESKVAALLAQ